MNGPRATDEPQQVYGCNQAANGRRVVGDEADAASQKSQASFGRFGHTVKTFGKFVGPGFMVAVAYIDPGNYATDVAAGASYKYSLLFMVLFSNVIAIFLQSLAIKLGTVSGMNLAEACRAFLPRWLNYTLYAMAEAAIIATDLAEVIGTAIALNLLVPKVPLVAGCAISILDVMIILVFYQPRGTMRGLRALECFVSALVLAVVVCFCIQLSLVKASAGEVLRGYVPSSTLWQQQALYQACGILGATVMPHSLYLGSGIVQARLRDFDTAFGLLPSAASLSGDDDAGASKGIYIPSLRAIRHSLKYSIAELAVSLFTFALFVNSAILIVAGARLYGETAAADADIVGIHDLLAASIAPAAGTVFALALLLSGVSAGVVCTIAGQMVGEGALRWTLPPWQRRLLTRSISIAPSIVVAGAVGRPGLNKALNASQVALSIALPFVSAPLIYLTCSSRFMTVQPGRARFEVYGRRRKASTGAQRNEQETPAPTTAHRTGHVMRLVQATLGGAVGWLLRRDGGRAAAAAEGPVDMANSWLVAALGVLLWLLITVLNIANLVFVGKGA